MVLRRPLVKQLAVVDEADPQQLRLSFAEVSDEVKVYAYAVLVTSLDDEILTATAEQSTPIERWCRVLSRALVKYLHGRQPEPPALLPASG